MPLVGFWERPVRVKSRHQAANARCPLFPCRLAARVQRRFTPRKPQRSPDRKASRERRRMLGGSSCMPPQMSSQFTEGERAVLCIISFEVKLHGVCDLAIDAIVARAGVCRTTAQNAIHEARLLLLITVLERPRRGMKSLTNVVRTCSRDWLAWIKRAPSAARLIGSKFREKNKPHGDHRFKKARVLQ
jgi:hypothetical protein